ncbi:MAG: VOC family protein [Deltaproteobacteria bacterium]|nr:VOC family protein [Deltaproteobacteria bacterium]
MLKSFWGINIAVKNLDEAIEKYEKLLGVKPTISSDPNMAAFLGITAASFVFRGHSINLMTSNDTNNPVGKFLERRGEGVLLVSLESDDIDKDVAGMQKDGLQFLWDENGQGGYGKVNFIPAKNMNGVQWEILEPVPEWLERKKQGF